MGVHRVFVGYALEQLLFDFQRILAGCQPRAVADAEDVRVHGHGGLTESHVEHHIGGLAAYAGKGFQLFAGSGYCACVQLNQHAAGLHQMLGLAAVQAYGLDVALQPLKPQIQNGLRSVGNRKKLARGLVHPYVGGLGRQQHGGQQLEHRGVFQLGLWRGVGGLERSKKRRYIVFLHGRYCGLSFRGRNKEKAAALHSGSAGGIAASQGSRL